jgi:hypothetical protein
VLDREWQVSEGGGVQGRWSSTTREIYYRSGRQMMSVPLDARGAEPSFGKPKALFADEFDFRQNILIPNYDVTRDRRFIMLRRGIQAGSLRVVTHWTEELKQILIARRYPLSFSIVGKCRVGLRILLDHGQSRNYSNIE